MTSPSFYITTAIAYPNGEPHVGHAYEAISADMLARFHRLSGKKVHFLTGIDDHGQKMVQTARTLGTTVEELGDRMAEKFRQMNQMLAISHDDFIRTKEERHKRASIALWEHIKRKGDIYLGTYEGWYCLRDEAYYPEEETVLRDGVRYGPNGAPVEWVKQESYFFKLSHYSERLLELYEQRPDFLQPPERLNEVKAFIKSGLSDLSISRSNLRWGIPVPGDAQHVMYVWVDALTNYISALGYPQTDNPLFEAFWPASLHIVGKDIIRFHAIIWPALLMAAELEVPKAVFGHGFLFHKGSKMSKSVGNVVSPFALAQKYGVDALRYFLLREVVYGHDGIYSDEAMRERLNADLSNDLGNLVQRCLSMVQKELGGVIPEAPQLAPADKSLLVQTGKETLEKYTEAVQQCKLHVGVRHLYEAIAQTNRYFAVQAPWKCKDDPPRLRAILFATMEALRRLSIQLAPIMPHTADKILDLLGVDKEERKFEHVETGQLKAGKHIGAFSPLFPRILEEPI